MKVIKGNIGAIEPRAAPVKMFRRRRRCNKKVLGHRVFKEGIHILLEAVHFSSATTYNVRDDTDEFSSKFNTMR